MQTFARWLRIVRLALIFLAFALPAAGAESPQRTYPGDGIPKEPIVRELFAAAAKMPGKDGEIYGAEFWIYSRRVARREGMKALDAVMRWCREDRGEAPLLLVPVLANLPRAETIRRLKAYEKSRNEFVRIYAHEMLTELSMVDEAAVRRMLEGK